MNNLSESEHEFNYVFIDETGDHNLNKIDQSYPVFALGALIISKNDYDGLCREIGILKVKYFNTNDIVLHSSELKRPNHKNSDNRNIIMNDAKIRGEFYNDLDHIISEAKLKVVVCLIEKIKYTGKYKYPTDPYYFCFENILSRVIRNDCDKINHLIAEKRHSALDMELKAEYDRLCAVGIFKYKGEILKSKSTFKTIDKKENVVGLQLIDLILYSVIRYNLGKIEKMKGNDINPLIITRDKMPYPITIFPK